MVAKDNAPDLFMVMATSKGIVKRTSFDKFASVRSNGLICMRLRNGEELIAADMVSDKSEVILVAQSGQAIKFAVKELRDASRSSGGVRGIKLNPDDELVCMGTIFPDAHLLTVTENGFGKFSRTGSYPLQARGGKGLRAHMVNEKTGKVVAGSVVSSAQHLIIITAKGIVIRISADDEVPLKKGRATQGVHLNKLDQDDKVVSIAFIHWEDNGEEVDVTN